MDKSVLITVIGIVGAVTPALAALAVAYGLLTQEQAELWVALIVALLGALGSIPAAIVATNYNDNRTILMATAIESGNQSLLERL